MSDWIEWKWTPEKPYPETDKKVYIRENDGWVSPFCAKVKNLDWYQDSYGNGITHYRIVED